MGSCCPPSWLTVTAVGLILWQVDRVLFISDSYRDHPALDVAVSHAILGAVARGEMGPTFRLHVPHRIMAFGMADRIQPGYPYAVKISEAHGFAPVERLAGGRAAVFHERTLAFSWATPEDDPRTGITQRFQRLSGLMARAFKNLKIDARVGEIPGEYCPGEYSVNVAGRVKVMGVGQRLVRGAAHVGGVIVVDDSRSIEGVLVPVYRALGIDWDPRTVGALADRSAGTGVTDVSSAVVDELRRIADIEEGQIPSEVVEAGHDLLERHVPEAA